MEKKLKENNFTKSGGYDSSLNSNFDCSDIVGFATQSQLKKFIFKSNNVLINIPYSSTTLPQQLIDSSNLKKSELNHLAKKAAALHSDILFEDQRFIVLKATYSKLYCDLLVKNNLKDEVVSCYYSNYHENLNHLCKTIIDRHDSLILINASSFSKEEIKGFDEDNYPDICLGYNKNNNSYFYDFINAIDSIIKKRDYTVKLNDPITKSFIPSFLKQKENSKIISLQININKNLYLDGNLKIKKEAFDKLQNLIKNIYNYLATYDFN